MRRAIGSLLVLTCVLSACSLTPTQAKKTPGKVVVKTTPRPSLRPIAVVSRRPSAAPVAIEGPTMQVKGHVELDAHYIVANNAGAIVAGNGGSAIVLNAGTLISDNGLGLISDNGLGLISNNGMGLIANNGMGYRLLATVADVALGTVLPVQGMAILPLSMRTGQLVGKPVFTDAQGAYTLEVPENLKGNLRIVAKVPVTKKDDPIARNERLQYNLVVETKATSKAGQLDEDTALVTKYFRACFANTIKETLLTEDVPDTSQKFLEWLKAPDMLLGALRQLIEDLNAAGKTNQLSALSDAQVDQIAQRATDVLLSYIDLDTLEVDPVALKRDHVQGAVKEFAIPAMMDVLKQVREGARIKMAANPVHFDTHPLILKAKKPYIIRRPSDLGDFMVEDIMITTVDRYDDLKDLFTSIDVPRTQAYRLNTLSLAILTKIGETMLTSSEVKVKMVEAIAAASTDIRAAR